MNECKLSEVDFNPQPFVLSSHLVEPFLLGVARLGETGPPLMISKLAVDPVPPCGIKHQIYVMCAPKLRGEPSNPGDFREFLKGHELIDT